MAALSCGRAVICSGGPTERCIGGVKRVSGSHSLQPASISPPQPRHVCRGRAAMRLNRLTAAGGLRHCGASSLYSPATEARRAPGAALGAVAELADGADHGNVIEIFSEADFKERLSAAGDKLVIVDVSTKWCGPCKVIYPKLVAMSKEYSGAVFLKIFGDHDANTKALMKEWKVRAVPHFRFFRGGELIHSHNGAKEEELRKHITKFHSEKAVAV